uniref:Uncharacterized protein n=1 Tax=Lygus hesperus TaxID=30085 RepID=A0A0A9Y0E4_LYGHE
MISGLWERERVAYLDNRIISADATLYASQDLTAISRNGARAKRRKNDQPAEVLRGSFTPLICSSDGVLHKEFVASEKRLKAQTVQDRSYQACMLSVLPH